jgi:DNA-binding LacI/PurR family transcriptional regulator
VNERARRAWEAAFPVFHPSRTAADDLLLIGIPGDRRALARRLRKGRPDAFVVSSDVVIHQMKAMGIVPPKGIPTISLHWVPTEPAIGGVDQSYDMIAANAVDLVVSQLNSNETGVPAWPRMLLFPGRWVEPERASALTTRTAGSRG